VLLKKLPELFVGDSVSGIWDPESGKN